MVWGDLGLMWLEISRDPKGRKKNGLPFRLHRCGAKDKGEFEGLKTLRGQISIMESLSLIQVTLGLLFHDARIDLAPIPSRNNLIPLFRSLSDIGKSVRPKSVGLLLWFWSD